MTVGYIRIDPDPVIFNGHEVTFETTIEYPFKNYKTLDSIKYKMYYDLGI